MKTILLSLSRSEATEKLVCSLKPLSSSAIRLVDDSACYGDVHEGEDETTFTVGFAFSGFTSAAGKIMEIDTGTSEFSYSFKGPFWSFLIRGDINRHFHRVFKSSILVKNPDAQGHQ